MDTLTLVLLAAIVLLVLSVVFLVVRRSGEETEAVRRQLALALSQQAETVQRVERSLREQEQALAKVVAERLDRTEKATGQIVTDLRERLARIDEAQKKIGELSSQVVSLPFSISARRVLATPSPSKGFDRRPRILCGSSMMLMPGAKTD